MEVPQFHGFWNWLAWFLIIGQFTGFSIVKIVTKGKDKQND